jgi:hypothetical protein
MSNNLQDGDEVKYLDPKTNKWLPGKIHGVRKVDDVDGVPRVLTYLVDTGADERLDVYSRSLRDEFISKEVNKHIGRGLTLAEAHRKIEEIKHLPPEEIVEDVVRQPKQVDVRPDHVRLA